MRKYYIIVIGVGLVVLFGYFGWQWNRKNIELAGESTVLKTDDNNFRSSGVLMRNNPGMNSGSWYLLADMPGAPGVRLELVFSKLSECSVGNQNIDCEKIDFPNGTRARISGERVTDKVVVGDLTAETSSDLISVDKISAGDKLESPLIITGKARGLWYFEASFPIKIVSQDGNLITTTIAQAQSEWMTNDFVPFKATALFDVPTNTVADLILAADNPSGLPKNDREIKIPVILLPSKVFKTVELFYYNSSTDKDLSGNILCSSLGLQAVKRQIPNTVTFIEDTVKLLLSNAVRPEEGAKGLVSEYPLPGVILNRISVLNGVATVEISDPQNKTGGGSCRVQILKAQIEKTVRQFAEIKEVKFIPDTLFQP